MRIEYELFLKGYSLDGFILKTKESIELIFRYGRTYKSIKNYCSTTHLGSEVEDFLDGTHVSVKYLSKYTLEHISNHYSNNRSTIDIWRGIKPKDHDIHVWNKETINIVRDKWPDIINGLRSYNTKIIKLCADIIPENRIQLLTNNDDIFEYYMNRSITSVDTIPLHILILREGELLYKILTEYPSIKCKILARIFDNIHRWKTLHYSIVKLLCSIYNMDNYIISNNIYQCLYLIRDWNISPIPYNTDMYIECNKLGKNIKFYELESNLSLPCSLGHKIYLREKSINNLELFMRLLDIHHDKIMIDSYITVHRQQYHLFHKIHHKYLNASRIMLANNAGLKIYATYNIKGSQTLYQLNKIHTDIMHINNVELYHDIVLYH